MENEEGGPRSLQESLTRREQNILEHLAHDKSIKEITRLETLTYGSVKWYIHQVYAKLGVNRRCEAITRARELGLLQTEPAAPDKVLTVKNNLPFLLTSFIGREQEIAQVQALLAQHRLVTLTGVGGTGKTRLALQVASSLLAAFPDGVTLVQLASLADPSLIPHTVITALGQAEQPGRTPTAFLVVYLRPKHLLLILDNCEHLVAACAELAALLLHNAPRLVIMASSRETLSVDGEIPFRVPSLGVPDPRRLPTLEELAQFEAVRLFVERAQVVSPEFTLSADNAAEVAQITQRLDGIPLAIELAAGRTRMMSANEIAARLDQAFRLLTGGSRSALPRQRTLKATIDWSYALLSGQERLMLQRLAVFGGSWTLEAAEAVCAGDRVESYEILDLLGGLVDKSLAAISQMDNGKGRYRMLETVRQYARDRLEESGDLKRIRDRHLDYYLRMGKQAGAELRSVKQLDWLAWLEGELENLRLALEWSLAGRLEDGLQLAAALMWFWHFHNRYHEAVQWLTKLLEAEAAARDSQPLAVGTQKMDDLLIWTQAVNALVFISVVDLRLGSMDSMSLWSEKAIALCRAIGEPAARELAAALMNKGGWLPLPDDEAILCFEESLEICRKNGYRFEEAECLLYWGMRILDGFQKDIDRFETGLAICRELGDPDAIATRLANIALYAFYLGDTERARVSLPEAIELHRKVGNLESAYNWSINLYFMIPEPSNALLAQEALAYFRDYRGFFQIRNICWVIQTEWSLGNYTLAESLAEEALAATAQPTWHPDKFYPRLWLARIALSQGNPNLADELLNGLIGAIRNENDCVGYWDWIQILETIGLVKTANGQMAQAVRMFAASDKSYQLWELGVTKRRRSERDAALTSSRAALGEEAFEREWQAGQAMTMWQAFEWVRRG